MSWIVIVAVFLGLWLAFKAFRLAFALVFKLLVVCLLLGGLYWLWAPSLGLRWPLF